MYEWYIYLMLLKLLRCLDDKSVFLFGKFVCFCCVERKVIKKIYRWWRNLNKLNVIVENEEIMYIENV